MEILRFNPFRCWLFALAAILCVLPFGVDGAAPNAPREATEGQLKAAYLYHFSLFTKWPSKAFSSATAPLVIGIVGEDPFGAEIDRIAATEKVRGRPIKVVRSAPGGAIPEAHILFVSSSEKERYPEIIKEVGKKPVLTVSDMAPFCRKGGMVRFTRRGNKIGLVINDHAARQAGLRITPDLLAISEIETTKEEDE